MSLWANFSLGFTYLSPVVGDYTLFAIALATGGPPMIWWLVIVGVGQFLVALVFGEVVSQFPVAGGVYPWARRLWGVEWAWMTGWVYLVALLTTIAGVVYGAGPYLAQLLGFTAGTTSTVTCALIMLALALAINLLGTKWLAYAAIIGFTAELLGALAVGGWLLITERHQNLSVLFDTQGVTGRAAATSPRSWRRPSSASTSTTGSRPAATSPRRCPDPTRADPQGDADDHLRRRRRRRSSSACRCCSPSRTTRPSSAARTPTRSRPSSTTPSASPAPRSCSLVVMVSFLSCALSLMAAASRLMYSYARDEMIVVLAPAPALPAHAPRPAVRHGRRRRRARRDRARLGLLDQGADLDHLVRDPGHLPRLPDGRAGRAARPAEGLACRPGRSPSAAGGMPVNVAALAYGVLTMINIAWPRTPDAPWYDNWLVALSAAVGVGVGAIYMVLRQALPAQRRHAGDAVPPAVRLSHHGHRRPMRNQGSEPTQEEQ